MKTGDKVIIYRQIYLMKTWRDIYPPEKREIEGEATLLRIKFTHHEITGNNNGLEYWEVKFKNGEIGERWIESKTSAQERP